MKKRTKQVIGIVVISGLLIEAYQIWPSVWLPVQGIEVSVGKVSDSNVEVLKRPSTDKRYLVLRFSKDNDAGYLVDLNHRLVLIPTTRCWRIFGIAIQKDSVSEGVIMEPHSEKMDSDPHLVIGPGPSEFSFVAEDGVTIKVRQRKG